MTHMMTALYDTRGAAETAREGLMSLGVADSAISIRGTDVAATGETAPAEDKSFWESVGDLFSSEDRSAYSEGMRRGGFLISAEVDEDITKAAEDVLERSDPIDVDERSATWRQEGWTGETGRTGAAGLNEAPVGGYAAARPAAYDTTQRVGDDKLQVVDEELQVGKRQVGGGGVRVRTYVTERPVEANVDLHSERVTVERQAVDREVAPGVAAFEDKTIEAVERSEEAVVSKTARVKEEITLRKDVSDRTETVHDTVRETEVDIDDDTGQRPRDSSQL